MRQIETHYEESIALRITAALLACDALRTHLTKMEREERGVGDEHAS
jgi:hypothetical protein